MSSTQETYLVSAEKGDRYDVEKDEVSIGRTAANDFHFSFPEVSSKHAVIKRVGDDWVIKDLGSTNGTFVNNQKIKDETPIKDGDRIKFGRKEYIFHNPAPEPEPQPEEDLSEEKTMLFDESEDDQKTRAFSAGGDEEKTSMFGGAEVAEGGEPSKSPFDKFSTSAFKKLKKEKKEKKPAEEPMGPSDAAAGEDEKTGAGAAASAPPDMPTMLAQKPVKGSVAPGAKVFGQLVEKTLATRKQRLDLTHVDNTIGSAEDNAVIIEGDTIAPHHAKITFEASNRIVIKLLDNNYGLKVNGKFYKTQPIKPGDTIEIGDNAYIFELKEMPTFRKRGGFLAKRKKLVAVAAILLIAFIGLFALQQGGSENGGAEGGDSGGTQSADSGGGTADLAPGTYLMSTSEIWKLIELKNFNAAKDAVASYTAQSEKISEQTMNEIQEINKTIDIVKESIDLFDDGKFYEALRNLDELPVGKAQTLAITNSMQRTYKRELDKAASEAYDSGVRYFKRGNLDLARQSFRKTLDIYPGYRDSASFLQQIDVAQHYKEPLENVRQALQQKKAEDALGMLDQINEFRGSDLSPKARADVEEYQRQKDILLKHANIIMMYRAGQGENALKQFETIPEDYRYYAELNALADRIRETVSAFNKAEQSKEESDYRQVVSLVDDPGNYYYTESKQRIEQMKKDKVAAAEKLIQEGRDLQIQGGMKRFDALAKYYQAYKVAPDDYPQALGNCVKLATDLNFEIYQMSSDKNKEKLALYRKIVENTPPDSKPHKDAKSQLNYLQ